LSVLSFVLLFSVLALPCEFLILPFLFLLPSFRGTAHPHSPFVFIPLFFRVSLAGMLLPRALRLVGRLRLCGGCTASRRLRASLADTHALSSAAPSSPFCSLVAAIVLSVFFFLSPVLLSVARSLVFFASHPARQPAVYKQLHALQRQSEADIDG